MTDRNEEMYAFMRDVIGIGMHLEGEDRLGVMMELAKWVSDLEPDDREQALSVMREAAYHGTGPLLINFEGEDE